MIRAVCAAWDAGAHAQIVVRLGNPEFLEEDLDRLSS